jgi:hypothetical protein
MLQNGQIESFSGCYDVTDREKEIKMMITDFWTNY